MALKNKNLGIDACFQRILRTLRTESSEEAPRNKEPPAITTDIEQMTVPSETVKASIKCMFDKLYTSNIQDKARELKSLITRKHLPWFSLYFVTQCVQRGFFAHGRYLRLLKFFDSEELYSLVLMDTVKRARFLLRKNQWAPSERDEGQILYLGHWLGVMHHAKNLPLNREYSDLVRIIPEIFKTVAEEQLMEVQVVEGMAQMPKSETTATTSTTAEVEIIVPSETARGKVVSTINTLCKENLKTKAIEIKNTITRKHLPWFSRYLITDRVPCEINSLLECLNSEILNNLILMDTVQKARVILERNATGTPSAQDTYLIKHIGNWLGMITLAISQPIPKEVIDFEQLLADACTKSNEYQLLVVRFVSKVLESRSGTHFGPNDPWIMSIMNCLFNVFKTPSTILRILLEIKKLCNLLNIKYYLTT